MTASWWAWLPTSHSPSLYPIPATNHSCWEQDIFHPTPYCWETLRLSPREGEGQAGGGLRVNFSFCITERRISLCPGAPAFLPVMLWCGDVTPQYRSHFAEREAVASQGFWLRPCHCGPAEPPWNDLPCPEINMWTDVSMVEAAASWASCYLQMKVPWADNGLNWRMENKPCLHHKYSKQSGSYLPPEGYITLRR